jgi:hypothetical protein
MRIGAIRSAVFRRSAPEQREHREHAAIVVFRRTQAKLFEDRLHVSLDGSRAEVELFRDRAVRAAFGDQCEHSALALGELIEGRAPVAVDEALDDLWIEGGPAPGDPLDRVDEVRDVPNAVLEEVPHSRRVFSDELEHVGRLEVLREDEHCRAWKRAPYLHRGDEAVVRVAGRHADVDDRDVRRVRADLEQQIIGVLGAADDLVPRFLQERRDPLTQKRAVVGDDDAQRPLDRHEASIEVAEGLEVA